MHSPISFRPNIRSLLNFPCKYATALAVNMTAERTTTTTTRIGTWLCPCMHTNPIHRYPKSSRNPLGTLICGGCKGAWQESDKPNTTFSPPDAVDFRFHPAFRRAPRNGDPRDRRQILHLPGEDRAAEMTLGYICTHPRCGMTWKAYLSKGMFGMTRSAIKLRWTLRKKCFCGNVPFQASKYVVFEMPATVAPEGEFPPFERADSGVASVLRGKDVPVFASSGSSDGGGCVCAPSPPGSSFPNGNRIASSSTPPAATTFGVPSAVDRITPYDQFAGGSRRTFTLVYAAYPGAPDHLIYSSCCA